MISVHKPNSTQFDGIEAPLDLLKLYMKWNESGYEPQTITQNQERDTPSWYPLSTFNQTLYIYKLTKWLCLTEIKPLFGQYTL